MLTVADVQVIVSLKACSTTHANNILIGRLFFLVCIEVGRQSVNDYFDSCIQFCITVLLSCLVFLWFRLSSFVVVSGFLFCLYRWQLLRLGANLKNFPSSTVPATYGILFHVGIAGVLLLYVFFWLKVRSLYTEVTLLNDPIKYEVRFFYYMVVYVEGIYY